MSACGNHADKANTCPYCGAPYGINEHPESCCRDDCEGMRRHAAMVSAAADADVREDDELMITRSQ